MRFIQLLENRFDTYKLVSSNQDKLREYKRFGLNIQIEPGKDLKEVQGSDLEVIIHKAKDAGPQHIVEDTSLNISGAEVGVNIRWLMGNLQQLVDRKAEWVVMIGVNTGQDIEIYKGVVDGIIVNPDSYKGFGFDPFFLPNGSKLTLSELDEIGGKDNFSARKDAVKHMLTNQTFHRVKLETVGKWDGEYQHD